MTELFAKRLPAFTDLRERARWLEMFAAWDAKAAAAPLAATARDGFAAWGKTQNGMMAYEGAALASLTTLRAANGDANALADYAAWIVTTTPAQAENEARWWLQPMMEHPNAPEIARAADTLFGSSAWVPLTSKDAGYYLIELLGSDLVHVAAFKKHVLAELANHAKLGTVRMRRGDIDVQTDAFQQSQGVDDKDPLLPAEGTVVVLRVADELRGVESRCAATACRCSVATGRRPSATRRRSARSRRGCARSSATRGSAATRRAAP